MAGLGIAEIELQSYCLVAIIPPLKVVCLKFSGAIGRGPLRKKMFRNSSEPLFLASSGVSLAISACVACWAGSLETVSASAAGFFGWSIGKAVLAGAGIFLVRFAPRWISSDMCNFSY
jgi:hypothetical protein